jgi:hypothetical protein
MWESDYIITEKGTILGKRYIFENARDCEKVIFLPLTKEQQKGKHNFGGCAILWDSDFIITKQGTILSKIFFWECERVWESEFIITEKGTIKRNIIKEDIYLRMYNFVR